MDKIGERIRALRKERGWTQTKLAEKVNVSPQVISNWERKYTDPDHDDIVRLAKAFDVSADYLLGRSKDRKEEFDELKKYEPIIREIAEKFPGVDINRAEIKGKIMKLIDIVLEDYKKKQ